jgi:predicted  nucleic acid-binding Zn-ribbon protein
MTKGSDLYSLQHLDTEDDRKRQRLAQVVAELGKDEQLEQARQAVARAKATVREHELRQRDLELEIQGLVAKTSDSEKRLYGGAVKNPRELSDLQAEIGALRRRQQKLEDDLLEAMVNQEEAENARNRDQAELETLEAQWSARQANLQDEQATLLARLSQVEQERETLVTSIDAPDLDVYRALRRSKGGLAVVAVEGDSCGGCGLAISPSLMWQIREGTLTRCSNCERILVRGDE